MKVINVEEGQTIAEAAAKAGAPGPVVGLLSAIFGEQSTGARLGESETFTGPTTEIFKALFDPSLVRDSGDENVEDEEDDFELDVDFEPDFELSQDFETIAMSHEDKVGAVAQFGRILEGLTTLADQHAQLLKGLVG
jgi:hypothetical protein